MACGCAVLSGVNPDKVAERFGFHVTDDDFAAGLKALLTDDHWRARGEAAREYVHAYYETSRSRDHHLNLYRQLLGQC
jgi:hypothetical protein